ncbi:MAG: hypothetical protein FWH17_02560 [Oscillospiraceae bacterium]|nr:hypothetical protein [Oscillospiraceae bacterium]
MALIHELKKIWNVKTLIIIFVLSGLYFIIALNSSIQSYPSGTWLFDADIAVYLTENYGATLEQDEFEDFLKLKEVIIFELDSFISSNAVFTGAGIYDFQDYENFRDDFHSRYDTRSEASMNLWIAISNEWGEILRIQIDGEWVDFVSDKEAPAAYTRYIGFNNVTAMYEYQWEENINSFILHTPLGKTETKRVLEIRDSGEMSAILSGHLVLHTWQYAQNLALLVVLAVFILVSPLVTIDKAVKVNLLQYSSMTGRKILKKQFAAVIISAIGITTLLLLCFAGIFYMATGARDFLMSGINSFMSFPYHWLSVTYGQYCLLIAGVIYLLSVASAAIAFVLSRFSQNLITLIFKVIPSFAAAVLLSLWLLDEFLGIYVGGDVFFKAFSLSIIFAAAIGIAIFAVKREKKTDLI